MPENINAIFIAPFQWYSYRYTMPNTSTVSKARKFLNHFDNNLMEYPRSWWRAAWNWNPLYWLRSHTFTKYHIVDCRNDYYDPSPYKWGWYDRSGLLLLANFNILVDFMENERPGEVIAWEETPEHSAAWKELNELYNWWKTGRKAEHEACDAILDGLTFKFEDMFKKVEDDKGDYWEFDPPQSELRNTKMRLYSEETDRLEKKDQEMLHRLIDIRGHMWT